MPGHSKESRLLNPDFRDILSLFNEEKVDYLVVGAYALAFHGLPRATGDIDLWVGCSSENARRIWRALSRFGAPLSGVEVDDFTRAGIVVQIGVAPRRIDVLTAIDGVEFDIALEQRELAEIDGLTVPILSKQHLIQNKRAVKRPKDQADLASLGQVES
jgi:hypothetical protein